MRLSDLLFKIFVGFSVMILLTTFIPTLESSSFSLVLSLVTLGIGILVAYDAIKFQEERLEKLKEIKQKRCK